MADSGKLAAGILLIAVAGLGAAGWFVLGNKDSADAGPGVTASPEAEGPEPSVAPAADGVASVAPVISPDAEPGSLEARIADLQAQLRDEQQAQLAEAQRLGEEVQALRATIAQLEADIQGLEEGRLSRLDARQDKQSERCDPAEPDSRACKRQAALEEKLGAAEQDRAGLEDQLAQAREREQALLEQRTAALRAVDELAERQRSDPELVALIRQLAAEG
jgi:hypothetical protein